MLLKAYKSAIFGQNQTKSYVSGERRFVPISVVFSKSLCATDACDGFVEVAHSPVLPKLWTKADFRSGQAFAAAKSTVLTLRF